MTLPVREQMTYWGIAAAVFFALLWFLGDVMTPFLIGMAVAYFLDPVADRLERLGFSRIWATVTITAGAFLLFAVAMLILVPKLVEQAMALINVAPEMANQFQTFMTDRFPALDDNGSTVRRTLVALGEAIKSRGGEVLNGALASLASIVNLLLLVVLVPVITFYLLMDWDRMIAQIDRMLPLDHARVIRRVAAEIDSSLAGFIRGQVTVCLILGTFYAVALSVLGLNYGLFVGFIAGLISFIPFVGSIVGGTLAIGLALFQFWGTPWMIAGTAGVFAAGQFLEGNILTPKLVGNSVGLHPVWLIFALSALGAVFGFVGLLTAVPIAAVLGVLIRFAIAQYRDSRLYKGVTWRHVALEEDARDGDDT